MDLFSTILSSLVGDVNIRRTEINIIDVEYEDLTPPTPHEEIIEDWTNGNPNKIKSTENE